MHPTWTSIFQKVLQTEEALVPIFVPANNQKAQGIAAVVILTETLFGQIFGIAPTAAATPPAQ